MQPSAVPAGRHKAYRGRAGKCKRNVTTFTLRDCHYQTVTTLDNRGANSHAKGQTIWRPPVLLCEPRCNCVPDQEDKRRVCSVDTITCRGQLLLRPPPSFVVLLRPPTAGPVLVAGGTWPGALFLWAGHFQGLFVQSSDITDCNGWLCSIVGCFLYQHGSWKLVQGCAMCCHTQHMQG